MTIINETIFVDGSFVPAHSSQRIDLVNPATEEVFATVVDADETDVDTAVRSARHAFDSWRNSTLQERADVLLAIADGIEARAAEMIDVLMTANGATRQWAAYVGPGSAFIYRGWAQFVLNEGYEEVGVERRLG